MTSDSLAERESVLTEIVEYLTEQYRRGVSVERKQVEEKFQRVRNDDQLSGQVDSLLSMPDWFSQSTVQSLTDQPLGGRDRSITKWGGYLLLEEIGRGGMGEVFKAWDIEQGRFVALKRMRSEMLANAAACRRFREEPVHVRKLEHEGIVPILDVGQVDDWPFFTMELIQGTSLVNLARHQALPSERIAEMILTVTRSVAVAHEAGVLHRDLKPANILLTTDLQPRLVDFGLAKDLQAESDLTGSLVLGTLNYMSPEQAAGQPASVQSDIYGIGAILYELLTARPPFRGASPSELLLRVQREEVAAPRQVHPHADPQLEAICLKCLEKEPQRRYSSATALVEEFTRVLKGQRQRAPFNHWARRLWRRARQNPVVASLLTALIGAFVVCAVLFTKFTLKSIEANTRDLETQLAKSQAVAADQRAIMAAAIALETRGVSLEQQGMWDDAITALFQAIEKGHPDPRRLRIEIAKCHLQLNQSEEAKKKLVELLGGELTERNRATVHLWLGHVLLGHNDAAAIESLKAARQHEELLDKADRAFLAGLLTDKLSVAAEQFALAVRYQPHHHEARRMLATSLFFLGRLKECQEQAGICHEFAPQDVPILMLKSVAMGLQGQHEAAVAYLDEAEGTPYESAVPLLMKTLNIIKEFHDVRNWKKLSHLQLVVKFAPYLQLLQAQPDPSWKRIPMPPQMKRVYLPVVKELSKYLFTGGRATDNLRRELLKATADVQEGTMLYILAELELQAARFMDAEKTLMAAYKAPSMFNLKNRIQYLLARIKWQLSLGADEKSQARYRREALEFVRLFAREPINTVLRPDELTQLGEITLVLRDLDVTREFANNWRRRHPTDYNPDFLLGIAYLKAKRYELARAHLKTASEMGCKVDKLPGYIKACDKALAEREELGKPKEGT